METYILLAITCILVNNIVLTQYLGICPFMGTSKAMETATGMSMAVLFVLVMAGSVTWMVEHWLLAPLGITFLRTIAFILIIASLVQFVEMFLKKSAPGLYAGLGIFLPLITTNCAVMGACLLAISAEYTFLQTLVASTAYALGFGLALTLFAGIRERLFQKRIPGPFRDTAIGLITAGVISLSFFAFKGMG
ncbi:RnfABCDGE type electron transport complex subunit A [Desulfobotulus sp. H1]|uniref:Ion-translocating oxidoreductase complex subunit A n=1 Tax=Desulfobotulus pelophilus TaxID=2823377 RepID=A0ABT3ND37_9BACT|nr:RnfABCDGE type electron transport complex subunit A [Desulfobotulus pelophilus]MCW7755382.1 RnfABCDGE type electron transport complex subunit A [Desulfobotulus pelophilus]